MIAFQIILSRFEGVDARPAGFEPATYGFVVRRSIQLSYGRMLDYMQYTFSHPVRQQEKA